jgi:hypothetical protein
MNDLAIIDEIIIILINWFNSLLSIPNSNKYLSDYYLMNKIGKRKKKKNAGSSGARRLPPSTITAGEWTGMCPVYKTSKLSIALLHWAVSRLFFFT